LVVGEGMRLALAGLLLGLLSAFALTRYLRSLLYGISPSDPLVLAAVTVLLGTVALAACFVPAYRASRIDPLVALREE
jgi:putative ABC transport system permease protein